MNTYVHLIDIIDTTTMTVMKERADYAFGTDGTDFWQKFFLCDKTHKDDRIIYLFTEYQLEFLWKWLNEKSKDQRIRMILEYSRQKMFNTIKTTQNKKLVDRICVGYVNSHVPRFKIQRVFFGVPPKKMIGIRDIDFFAGRFREKLADNLLTDKGRRELLSKLVKMRTEIEKTFRSSLKKDEKWLRYLGPKCADIGCIEYCTDLNSGCPYKLGCLS